MDTLSLQKQKLGLLYGLFAGLALAISLWGMDAFLLWKAHAAFAWVRFLIGGLASVVAFCLAGWLTMRFEKALLGALFWLAAALVPANLGVLMIFDGWPVILSFLQPEMAANFITPEYSYGALSGLLLAILGISSMIVGGLEVPLVGQSLFSSAAGALAPAILLVMLIFSLAGILVDNTMHIKLRESIYNLDHTIQFVAENDMAKVDKTLARQMHAAALKPVGEAVRNPRRLFVTSFDQTSEQVEIWVDFSGTWAQCSTVSNQVINCKLIP